MSTNLEKVDILGADAVGQPGQRRFRLYAQSRRGSIVIWMEKEYLNNLSLALDRVLAHLTEGQVLRVEAQAGGRPQVDSMPASFPYRPDHEFQAGQVGLTYDDEDELFVLTAMPLEVLMEPDEEPVAFVREDEAVSFVFSMQQAQELSSSINRVVSAGRPTCPFCGTPLDGSPHACVKQNGHRKVGLVETEDEE